MLSHRFGRYCGERTGEREDNIIVAEQKGETQTLKKKWENQEAINVALEQKIKELQERQAKMDEVLIKHRGEIRELINEKMHLERNAPSKTNKVPFSTHMTSYARKFTSRLVETAQLHFVI